MEFQTPVKETIDIILEEGGSDLKSCYQCGLCTGVCPWNRLIGFTLRKLIHKTQLGVS